MVLEVFLQQLDTGLLCSELHNLPEEEWLRVEIAIRLKLYHEIWESRHDCPDFLLPCPLHPLTGFNVRDII